MDRQMKQIYLDHLEKCGAIPYSQPTIINQDGVYGIEYEGYQTLKVQIEPVFDMPDEKVDALVSLLALSPPLIKSIIDENEELLGQIQELEDKVNALVDCVAAVSLVASEKIRKMSKIEVGVKVQGEDEPVLTVGEE